MKTLRKLAIVSLTLLLTACSSGYHVKRIEPRLISGNKVHLMAFVIDNPINRVSFISPNLVSSFVFTRQDNNVNAELNLYSKSAIRTTCLKENSHISFILENNSEKEEIILPINKLELTYSPT